MDNKTLCCGADIIDGTDTICAACHEHTSLEAVELNWQKYPSVGKNAFNPWFYRAATQTGWYTIVGNRATQSFHVTWPHMNPLVTPPRFKTVKEAKAFLDAQCGNY